MAPSAHSNTRSNTASPAQSNNTGDMTRSPSAEPSKTTKRKGKFHCFANQLVKPGKTD